MAERTWPGERAAEVVREITTHLILDGGNDDEAIQLVQAVSQCDEVIPTEGEYRVLLGEVLAWKEPELTKAVERVYTAPSCPVTRTTCQVHGQVHGAEAEELRRGIENLLFEATTSHAPDDWPAALQKVLDRVDARDSLAFLEAGDRDGAEVRTGTEAATCNDCGARATVRRADFGQFCNDCAPAIDGLTEIGAGASESPTPLRPAADVAREMVSDPDFDGDVWRVRVEDAEDFVPLEYQGEGEFARAIADDATQLIARLIDRSRTGGAAAAKARIAELDAAMGAMLAAFSAFEEAHDGARRAHHNHEEWRDEQWGPIQAARTAFYNAAALVTGSSAERESTVFPRDRPISGDLGPCPRAANKWCCGRLAALVSDDGSAFEAEVCMVCLATWWNQHPLAPPRDARRVHQDELDAARRARVVGRDE